MTISDSDPRLIRIDTRVRSLGLSSEEALSCLIHAVAAYSEQGLAAVTDLRRRTRGKNTFTFDFDEFAEEAGVTSDQLLDLFDAGVQAFGERFGAGGTLQ